MNKTITVNQFLYYYLELNQNITILDSEQDYPYFNGTVDNFYTDKSNIIYHGAHIHHITGRTNINHENEIILYI